MLTFRELKPIIAKACSSEHSNSLSQKLHFSVDFRKLEKELRKNNTRLHVVAGCETAESYVPDFNDIQLLSEYPHRQDVLSSNFLNGSTQIVTFMLFTDKNGELTIKKEDGTSMTYDEIFERLNGEQDHIDKTLLYNILDNFPMNRVVVTKRFNDSKERFDYNFYFRSNYQMVSFNREQMSTEE